MENKEVQALDSEYLLSLMKQANTDKDAAFELGKQYMNGTKIPQDTRRVLFYFQQATDLGHSESQMISGYLYKVGAWDLKPDPLKAAELLQWEAINLFLYGGIGGTPLNEYRGVSLLVFMSQLEIPYAMYLLGKAHENGLWGVSKDKEEAIRLYRESANLGCTAAMLFQP